MITEDKRFIDIQGILAMSDVHPADCIKINDLIIELSKENQELKLELSGYRHAILNNKEMLGLKEQNDKLKKQLEEINKIIEKCGFVNIEQVMLNYCGLLTQQKEFIEYLEYQVKLQEKLNDIHLATGFEEILSKYKEIIGGKDDNK